MCFSAEEIPENHPDKHDCAEDKDLLLAGGDEGVDNIGCDKKLKAKDNFAGELSLCKTKSTESAVVALVSIIVCLRKDWYSKTWEKVSTQTSSDLE